MDTEAAIKAGAMALFGEKYGDEVRVVAMGTTHANEAHAYSVELCGGTHARRTGDIGLFKIVAESAVAAGVRRVEAVTGAAAEAWVAEQDRLVKKTAAALKIAPTDLPVRVAALIEERRALEKEITDLRRKLVASGGGGRSAASGPQAKTVAQIMYAGRVLQDIPAKDLKGMADDIKAQIGSCVVALISVADGKASLVVAVSEDLTAKLSAVDLVKAGSAILGGKGGGGRPDMAQAGGPDGAKADQAVAEIEAEILRRIS